MGKIYAYKRVSTLEQNLDRELPDFKADVVLEEKVSAKDAKRPKLEMLLEVVGKGDEIHIHELSRLARSVQDLIDIVQQVVGKGASIKFHKEGLEFAPDKKANSFQSLMLNLLGSIAQFERDLMLERQREGISIAKQKGVYKGRQSRFSEDDFKRIKEQFKETKDKTKLAKKWGISRSYLYQIAKGEFSVNAVAGDV